MDVEIKGFLETSFLDWPGRVASVVFLAGCNFRCPFCHNHGLVLNPQDYPTLSWPDVKARLRKFAGWVDGVVVTGGEPTLSPGLPALLEEIRAIDLEVKLDTNGSRPEVLQSLIEAGLIRHVAMDVKAPLDDVSYARAAGRPGFQDKVRTSLDLLAASGLGYTLRTTVVPGLHGEKDIMRLAGQLAHAPDWKLQKFNPVHALDCSYRELKTWGPDEFDQLTRRAEEARRSAA